MAYLNEKKTGRYYKSRRRKINNRVRNPPGLADILIKKKVLKWGVQIAVKLFIAFETYYIICPVPKRITW